MNIRTGFCPCLDCQQNGLCAHLIASEQLFGSEHGELFEWSSAVRAPANADAPIELKRLVVASRLPEGVQEPTASCDPGRLVQRLAAAHASRSSSAQSKQLTEPQTEVSSLNSSLFKAACQMSDGELRGKLPELRAVVDSWGQHIPGFKKLRANPTGRGRRRDGDRTEKPLYSRGRSSSSRRSRKRKRPEQESGEEAAAGSHEGEQQQRRLVRLPESGRRRTTVRGLGSFDRGPSRKAGGGLRPRRYNPYKANWGTGLFVRVGAGLQLAGPQQQQQQQREHTAAQKAACWQQAAGCPRQWG